MADTSPRISRPSSQGGQALVLQGQWTAGQLADPLAWAALQRDLRQPLPAWDLRQITRFDHVGAQLLWNSWGRRWPPGLEALPAQRAVLERVARYTVPVPPRERHGLAHAWWTLGGQVLRLLAHLMGMLRLVGQLALDVGRLVRKPSQGPWRDFSGHLYHFGATALPITALVGFLIGVVLAYLMAQQLRLFGADPFIVNIMGISVIRELGPVLAAILIAGRSGSTITAQLGVMRVTEEIDAMRVMGIARSFRLVLPRVLAMTLAMPLLAVWTTVAALLGGMLAADVTLDVSPSYFITALPDAVMASNLTLAASKSAVFGLMIALVGCHFGLRIKPDTESLGQGTTASVVVSITMVILVDALFAVLFRNVGI
ncbi:MAG: ABC transporter permease [Hylemonella sp.]|nr:ABC transporter permease [Hylemonella sp.]